MNKMKKIFNLDRRIGYFGLKNFYIYRISEIRFLRLQATRCQLALTKGLLCKKSGCFSKQPVNLANQIFSSNTPLFSHTPPGLPATAPETPAVDIFLHLFSSLFLSHRRQTG